KGREFGNRAVGARESGMEVRSHGDAGSIAMDRAADAALPRVLVDREAMSNAADVRCVGLGDVEGAGIEPALEFLDGRQGLSPGDGSPRTAAHLAPTSQVAEPTGLLQPEELKLFESRHKLQRGLCGPGARAESLTRVQHHVGA